MPEHRRLPIRTMPLGNSRGNYGADASAAAKDDDRWDGFRSFYYPR
jgi:hypothetical protein